MKFSIIDEMGFEILPTDSEEFLIDQSGKVWILDLDGGRDMPLDALCTKHKNYSIKLFGQFTVECN